MTKHDNKKQAPEPTTRKPRARAGEHPGITALRDILWSARWHDQGGYVSFNGDGKWGFVTAGLPQATPEQWNALLDLVGIVPGVIESLGSCENCKHAVQAHGRWVEQGYSGPCSPCKRPRMSNFVPRERVKPRAA